MNATLKLLGILILRLLDMGKSLSGYCFNIQKLAISLYRAHNNAIDQQSVQQR